MRAVLLALVVLLAVASLAPASGAATRPAVGPEVTHYLPKVGDDLVFRETIAVSGGYGNYSGYTESDAIVGYLNVSAVSGSTVNATYAYYGHYTNTTANYPWHVVGAFNFSSATFDYTKGTDNQSGAEFTEVWFYMNNSLADGAGISPLGTPMTVGPQISFDDSFAGAHYLTVPAEGTGTYERDDSYGEFGASYTWAEYFDPSTGYVVGYSYVEQDANPAGDGFTYVDTLGVVSTSFPLTTAPAAPTYDVTIHATGLRSGAAWTATLGGVAQSGTSGAITFSGLANATYLFSAGAAGYAAKPSVGWVGVSGGNGVAAVAFATNASSGPDLTVVYLVVAVVAVVVIVIVVLALARRARRGPALPRHSFGGQPQYGPPPVGPAPPPISLSPSDQPRIQQVVVKEVVKVPCRYCGSLIDSTVEKCPFCGATRS